MVPTPHRIPEPVATFRSSYRAEEIGKHYSGWGHFAFTSIVSLGAVALSLSRLSNVGASEWLAVPCTFVFANLAEYFGHKGAMHRPRAGLGLLYRRHTLQHHHFYTHDAMVYESAADLKMVLFPPVMLLFFLGAIATPIGGFLFVVASPNVAWLYVATATSYFLSYEWLHVAHHLDPDGALGRLRLLRLLRQHHQAHHDLRLMGRYNFNVTFPIADFLFGTVASPQAFTERRRTPPAESRTS
jgi:hypothetical protein